MHAKLNKEACLKMERAILFLQENPQSQLALNDMRDCLRECFGIDATVTVVPPKNPNDMWFIMSVYPDQPTVEKIIDALMKGENQSVIQKLWEQTKNWNIEIDERVFGVNPKFTERELVAIILHEVGHIAITNSVSNRICNIMRYKIAMTQMENKVLLRDKIFKKVLSLPILNACISASTKDKESIADEIKADSFVKKLGYKPFLVTALNKMIPKTIFKNGNDEMADVTHFSLNTIDQFRQRRDKLVKEYAEEVLNGMGNSPYFESVARDALGFLFTNEVYAESAGNRNNVEFLHDRADQLVTEAFNIFKTKLERINPTDIDYVDMKISACKSVDDKMMLISYCRSKIDMIDYYISILNDPKIAKRYRVPHSLNELTSMKQRFLKSIEEIKKFKLPIFAPGLLVKWPSGYEG